MILRRLSSSLYKQDWATVFIEIVIVVVGVFLGIQASNWNEAREERASEHDYLERLHNDIEELTNRRAPYNISRPLDAEAVRAIIEFTNGDSDSPTKAHDVMVRQYTGYLTLTPAILESLTCNTIDWTSALTLPPAALPTATELISAGRLNQIESEDVRLALLSYIQETRRAEDFTQAMQNIVVLLSDRFPDLFTIRFDQSEEFSNYVWPRFTCDYTAMRDNHGFLNALNRNQIAYSEYAERAVLTVTESLVVLHKKVDHALGIVHVDEESK